MTDTNVADLQRMLTDALTLADRLDLSMVAIRIDEARAQLKALTAAAQ